MVLQQRNTNYREQPSQGSAEPAACARPLTAGEIAQSPLLLLPSFLPPHPPPAVGGTWAGEGAPWLGRTETPAEERRGRSRWTTSRRSLISKRSWERESKITPDHRRTLYYRARKQLFGTLMLRFCSVIFSTNTLGHLN